MNINPVASPSASFKGNFVENDKTRQVREMAEKSQDKNMHDAVEKLNTIKELVERGCSDGYFWELTSKDEKITPNSELIMYRNGTMVGHADKARNLKNFVESLEEPLVGDVVKNLKRMERDNVIKEGVDFKGEFVTLSPLWGLINREANKPLFLSKADIKASNALKSYENYRELVRYGNSRYELLPSGQVYDVPKIDIKIFRDLRNIGVAGTYESLSAILDSSKSLIIDDALSNLKRLNIKSGRKLAASIK